MTRSLLDFVRMLRPIGRRGVARVVVGALLSVHTAVIAAAPVVDALAGHPEAVAAHWDDAQERSCPPQHDPAICQLCHLVQTPLGDGTTEAAEPIIARRVAGVVPADDGLGEHDVARLGAPHPRGPPKA